jgi:glucosyl-3-phosphoglycerate synthase
MWRALSALDGELVCFLDADTHGFSTHFATGLIGPLVCEAGVSFVKGFYRRPLVWEGGGEGSEGGGGFEGGDGGGSRELDGARDGGGRVNHLTARPALALLYPELAGVRQPLAGEVAARRELLETLPFATGYGVEIAMLIDCWRKVGLDGIAQVDLDEHRNRHQPLSALAPMALTVLATVLRRVRQEGRLLGLDGGAEGMGGVAGMGGAEGMGGVAGMGGAAETDGAPVERPPLAGLSVV